MNFVVRTLMCPSASIVSSLSTTISSPQPRTVTNFLPFSVPSQIFTRSRLMRWCASNAPAAEAFEAHHLINLDLVKIWDGTEKGKKFVTVLGWGDEIVVLNEETMEADGHIKVRTTKFIAQSLGAEAAEPQVGYVVP